MSLYYVVVNEGAMGAEVNDALARIKTGISGRHSSPYIAFTSKDLGNKYLTSRNMNKNFTLQTLEEIKAKHTNIDMNNGTVVFQNEKQITDSLADKTGQALRNLTQ